MSHGRSLASLALALTLGTAASCSGTGGGGTGDPGSAPDTEVLGDGQRIDDLVGEATWLSDVQEAECPGIPGSRNVRVTGLQIVAIDTYGGDGNADNVYAVQLDEDGDPPGPYQGISLRLPGYSPPDLRLLGNEVIDVDGVLIELPGPPGSDPFGFCRTLPQIEGTITLRFDGTTNVPPYLLIPALPVAPAVTEAERWAPLTKYELARAHIGMLVTVENVTLVSPDDPEKERWNVSIDVGGGLLPTDVPKISNELYDVTGTGPAISPDAPTHFTSITGILTYFYGFKIAPRSPADFVR